MGWITDEKRLAKLFNKHYINTVERSSGYSDKRIELCNIKKHENHSSTIKVKNVCEKPLSSNNILTSAMQVTSNEVNLILKSLNTKKVSISDKTPTKLIKLASNFLSRPLAIAINNIHASSKFPDMAKVTTVIPIDKKTDDKYISNFQPVSLLNCFTKVYDNIIKCRLYDAMHNNISPFISAYRKNYNTQHVNPLSANPEKWSNTLKQIVDKLPTICLSVFDHFMNSALKGLRLSS